MLDIECKPATFCSAMLCSIELSVCKVCNGMVQFSKQYFLTYLQIFSGQLLKFCVIITVIAKVQKRQMCTVLASYCMRFSTEGVFSPAMNIWLSKVKVTDNVYDIHVSKYSVKSIAIYEFSNQSLDNFSFTVT